MDKAASGMRNVWVLAAATTLVVTSFSMFSPLLAVQLQQRGFSTTEIGLFAMILEKAVDR